MPTPTSGTDRARSDAAPDDDIDPFLEAAWYALVPFINPLDCARRVVERDEDGNERKFPVPLNYNDTLNALYNGDLVERQPVKPTWFSKKRLANHLSERETYYYRSRPNGLWREGYGSYDRARLKLGIAAQELQIDTTCRRFGVGVLLLCADIDCHNGEKDVAAVRDWLLDRYFPGAYWEPSTGGKGVHLYVKVAYKPWLLKDRDASLRHVVNTIEQVAVLLDRYRKELGYDAPVDKLRGLPSLLSEKNGRIHIQRSTCIKIPRFKNGLQDVRAFHVAPFYLFDYFERLEYQGKLHPEPSNVEAHPLVRDALGWDIEPQSPPLLRNKGGGGVALNSVYPSYTECLDDLRQQNDAFTRTMGFALAYARHIRQVPSVEQALTEYEAQGLSTGADENGARRSRMGYVLQHVAKTFKPSIDLASGFQNAQNALLAEVGSRICDQIEMTYTKAQGRREAVRINDIAAVLHVMRQSQGRENQTAFSQLQVMAAIKTTTGKGCSKNKASCITKALKAMGFIHRVGGYIPGVRGTVFRVVSPNEYQGLAGDQCRSSGPSSIKAASAMA